MECRTYEMGSYSSREQLDPSAPRKAGGSSYLTRPCLAAPTITDGGYPLLAGPSTHRPPANRQAPPTDRATPCLYATHTPPNQPPQPSHCQAENNSCSAHTTHAKSSTDSSNKDRRSKRTTTRLTEANQTARHPNEAPKQNTTASQQEVMTLARPTSSRTGTTEWRKVRAARLKHDRENGVTNCKHCGVWLDYDRTRLPNSAEPDHIEPWHHTRSNDFDGLITICRKCNQSIGGKQGNDHQVIKAVKVKYQTAIKW